MFRWINPDGSFAGVQVKFNRTIVGYYNLRLAGGNDNYFVNLSPDQFAGLGLSVSKKARLGCGEISHEQANELFGKAAVIA